MVRLSAERVRNAVRYRAVEALRSRGFEVQRVPRVFVDHPNAALRLTLEHVVAHRLMTGDPNLFVVQVGAFDGVTNDPIHAFIKRFGWRGVLAEPQSRAFARLETTYADSPGIVPRNVAVSDRTGRRTFYQPRADAPSLPDSIAQLASFDLTTILAHRDWVPNLEEFIESSEVDCVTFEDLLVGVDRVDLLQVDAEGYDAVIIRLFDFDRWRPNIVNFESAHLEPSELDSVVQHLVSYGYQIARSGMDTIAYLPQ